MSRSKTPSGGRAREAASVAAHAAHAVGWGLTDMRMLQMVPQAEHASPVRWWC